MADLTFFARDGMIRASAVLSVITTSNTYHDLTVRPLNAIFNALVIGAIGGGVIESLTPPVFRPFVCCGLFCLTLATILGRAIGWIPVLQPYKSKTKTTHE